MSLRPDAQSDLFFENLALKREIDKLKDAIRNHRDQKGDDRCWLDDQELYKVLGEGEADFSLPPKEKFLTNCSRYYDSRCNKVKDGNEGQWISRAEIENQNQRIHDLRTENQNLSDQLAEAEKNYLIDFRRCPDCQNMYPHQAVSSEFQCPICKEKKITAKWYKNYNEELGKRMAAEGQASALEVTRNALFVQKTALETENRALNKIAGLRQEIQIFAQGMEEKLRRNDHKGTWIYDSLPLLMKRLKEEVEGLDKAIAESPPQIIGEAFDVGNFAMMISDVYAKSLR